MSGTRPSRGPRHVLLRYLSVTLLSRMLMLCGILVALMEVLALLEQMTPILRRHLGAGGVLTYMVLHLPLMLQTALPLSVLVGTLVMLTQLTVNSEMAILRASGLSTVGFIGRLIPATLLVGFLGAAIEDQVTPRAELALASWWNRTDPQPETGRAFWFSVPESVLRRAPQPAASQLAHIGYVTDAGRHAFNIDLYDRDAAGNLLRTVHAARADFGANGWELTDIRQVTPPLPDARGVAATVTAVPAGRWVNPFSPKDMLRLSMEAAPLSIAEIWRALHGRFASTLTSGYLKAALIERLLRPFALVVMLLLAAPVIYIPPRTGMRSWLPVWCLGGGLLFIIVQGMFRAMGNAGLLPAPVATIPGLIIFTMAAGAVLLRNEDQ